MSIIACAAPRVSAASMTQAGVAQRASSAWLAASGSAGDVVEAELAEPARARRWLVSGVARSARRVAATRCRPPVVSATISRSGARARRATNSALPVSLPSVGRDAGAVARAGDALGDRDAGHRPRPPPASAAIRACCSADPASASAPAAPAPPRPGTAPAPHAGPAPRPPAPRPAARGPGRRYSSGISRPGRPSSASRAPDVGAACRLGAVGELAHAVQRR